jgi:hypothetical protein
MVLLEWQGSSTTTGSRAEVVVGGTRLVWENVDTEPLWARMHVHWPSENHAYGG